MKHDYILFYDGDCPFCNRMILWLLKKDKKEMLRYAPLESAYFKALVPNDQYDRLIKMDTLVFVEKGEIHYYSNAILKAMGVADIWWLITFKMSFVPRSIRDFIYTRIALIRKNIYSTCKVIPQSKRHLFLP